MGESRDIKMADLRASCGELSFCFLFLFVLVVRPVSAAKCEKVDDCTCKMDDGTGTVSLWEIDGRKSGPSFKDIKESKVLTFSWNPCTSFSDGCSNVKLCQRYKEQEQKTGYFPIGNTVSSFTVYGKDTIVMAYSPVEGPDSKTRTGKITLHCNRTVVGKKGLGNFKENDALSLYTATLQNKCACPGACKARNTDLSIGSTLLIVFFTLLVVYLVGGILINKFGRHVDSMPEMIPNLSFWKDLPFLFKDGCVFTFSKLRSLCGNSSYEKI